MCRTHKLKKGKKIMKKIMVLAVAMFAMATATFAADEETNATAAYNMNIKMSSLADALSLNIDQVEAVADVHKNFTADMMNAATAKGEDRSAMIDKAVLKDLKYMHVILDNISVHNEKPICTDIYYDRPYSANRLCAQASLPSSFQLHPATARHGRVHSYIYL